MFWNTDCLNSTGFVMSICGYVLYYGRRISIDEVQNRRDMQCLFVFHVLGVACASSHFRSAFGVIDSVYSISVNWNYIKSYTYEIINKV